MAETIAEVPRLKFKVVNWRNLAEEARYWDALDLLRNLDEEMENARRGLTSCVFCRDLADTETAGRILLKPEVLVEPDHLEITFPNLKNVRKEDIDVTTEDHELEVDVSLEKEDGKVVVGWFRMSIPQDYDAEACEAEHEKGSLKICLKKRVVPARKKIKLK